MRKVFFDFCKRNILVIIMIILLCPVLTFSYASFISSSSEYRASEMYIGKLLYSMTIDNNSTNTVTIPANDEKEIVVEVTSLNTVSTNYKIVYTTNENITAVYASDDNDPTVGLVTTTKKSTILLTNSSASPITITFSIVGGYKQNNASEIAISNEYSEIEDTYIKYDYETIALFVDDVRVNLLDPLKRFELIDSSCTNDETVTYNSTSKTLSITPMTEQTKCTLNFIERVNDTLLEKMDIDSALSDSQIDFGSASSSINGQGLYYTSDLTKTEGGEVVYYYRGAVENNYAVFAGYCWRIVRTNEDGSIKLRYGGEPLLMSGNSICPTTGTDVGINNNASVAFNSTYNDNTYVGYMMGLNGSGTSTSTNAQTNTYDSNIKRVVDAWYRDNIANQGTNITSKIANTIYCNDRSIGNSGTIYGGYGTFTSSSYGQKQVLYGAARRLATGGPTGTSWSNANANPQYKCPNVSRDGFTLSTANGGTAGYGNNALTYPIGLLTPDEVAYAGGVFAIGNTTYYLYTNQYYWTMGAERFNSNFAYVFLVRASGFINDDYVTNVFRAVPVISLNSNVIVLDGTGEYNSPYIIE